MSDSEKETISKSISSPTSTPFSINDILTKNNTSVLKFRQHPSGETSPISQRSRGDRDSEEHFDETSDKLSDNLLKTMKFYKHPYYAHLNTSLYFEPSQVYPFRHHHHQFIDPRSLRISSDSPSMENQPEIGDIHYHQRRISSSYPNRNADENDITTNGNGIKKIKSNILERRKSLDCFLVDANHNNQTAEENAFDENEKSRSRHLKMNFYNFPVIGETPLDMRRCISESGECQTEN